MKVRIFILAVLALVYLGLGCSDDDSPSSPADDPRPVITSIDPTTLIEGIVTTVNGEHFGDSGELFLDNQLVDTTVWTDTIIVFTVPQGIGSSNVDIRVQSGGQTSAAFRVTFVVATERQLTFDGMNCYNPCWSDDGSSIYFEAEAPDGTVAFYSVPSEGGEVGLLYNGPGNDRMLDVRYGQTGAVIWITDRDDWGNLGGDWEVMDGSTGFNPMGWSYEGYESNEETERYPVWSHTPRLNVDCAWTQDRPGGGSVIYVRRIGVPDPLVSGFSPCFDPDDGEYLAYLTPSPTMGHDIMKIRVVEDPVPELIYRDETTGLGRIAWGNGGRIAYMKGSHIWIMNDDGTNHRKLTDGHDQEAYPKFSPNGNWVAFSRLVTTEWEIFVARVP